MTTSAAPTPIAAPAPSGGRPAPARRSAGRGVWRRVRPVFFWTHLAVGVAVGVVVLIMSLTGVLLAYQRQLTEWSAGANAAAPPNAAAPRLPLDTVLARAAAAAPAGGGPTALTVRSAPEAAVAVAVGMRQSVYVNPYTGAVTRPSPRLRAFFVDAERWHRSLATGESLRDAVGVTVTGACNLGFLFLVVTGLFLWWPRQWTRRAFAAVGLFQRRASGRQRDWNWHHVLGIWSAVPLAAVVFSAVFISYQWPQRLVERVMGSPSRAEPERGGGRGGEGGRRAGAAEGRGGARRGEGRGASSADGARGGGVSLDTLVARAAVAVPGWQSVQLRLPAPDARRLTATVSTSTALRPDRRTQLTFDARTGAVVERQGYADNDAARRFRSWMRGLHTGEAAGLVGQTVAMLVSAAGVVLVYTGLALSWRRLRASLARRKRVRVGLAS